MRRSLECRERAISLLRVFSSHGFLFRDYLNIATATATSHADSRGFDLNIASIAHERKKRKRENSCFALAARKKVNRVFAQHEGTNAFFRVEQLKQTLLLARCAVRIAAAVRFFYSRTCSGRSLPRAQVCMWLWGV